MTAVIAVVAVSTGSCFAVTGGAGCSTSTVAFAAVAVGFGASTVGSVDTVFVAESVGSGWTVAALTDVVGLLTGSVVAPCGLESLDFFFVVGVASDPVVGAGFLVAVGFVSVAGSAVGLVGESADADELVDESVPVASVVSAAATPWPAATAAPMPNATARPPTRPTNVPSPMAQIHTVCKERPYASSVNRRG
jgi:hypothetical protein